MTPTKRLLKLITLWLIWALLIAFARWLFPVTQSWQFLLECLIFSWYTTAFTLVCLSLYDLYNLYKLNRAIDITRTLPRSFAIGANNHVQLTVNLKQDSYCNIDITDHYPAIFTTQGLPHHLSFTQANKAQFEYSVRPLKRGDAHFGNVFIKLTSKMGLIHFYSEKAQHASSRVYPNFMAIAKLESLGFEQQLSHVGAHIQQRRGLGLDFRQLREYQEGDAIRQVDWKATARQLKLVSREYQDERDQDIVFLLDAGRRLRTQDDELSHFDHCLNAMLLTSYVALSAGDAVGLLSFAGSQQRWLSPVKGQHQINTLLNQVYDLHSSTHASDLLQASTELLARQRKRALVVIITNLRDDDADDIIQATHLMSRNHLVMVACLQDEFLKQNLNESVDTFESALNYAGTHIYAKQRETLLKKLRNKGCVVVDAQPKFLHQALVNEYIQLKRSGRI